MFLFHNRQDEGGILFLDAPGGAGRQIYYNLILAKLQSEGKVALTTTSSGMAATLLTRSHTLQVHLKFH